MIELYESPIQPYFGVTRLIGSREFANLGKYLDIEDNLSIGK